jgi:hypothetical protein
MLSVDIAGSVGLRHAVVAPTGRSIGVRGQEGAARKLLGSTLADTAAAKRLYALQAGHEGCV